MRLRAIDVPARRPRLHELARVEQVDVVLDLVLFRARGKDDAVAEVAQPDQEPACPGEKPDLVDHLRIPPRLGLTDLIAQPLLDVIAGDRGDELVASHPVVTMHSPQRHLDAVIGKRTAPGDRVVVARVDECPVDVDDRADKPAGPRNRPRVEWLAGGRRRLPGRRL